MSDRPVLESRDGRLPGRASQPGAVAEPDRGRSRRAVKRALELLLVLLLMLTCFIVLLVMLDRVFPSATSLGDLMRAAGRDRSVPRTGAASARRTPAWQEAVLRALGNEVLRKTSGSVAWEPARNGSRVAHGDGVQTQRDGTAVLAFDRDDWLRIGRNSLVILRDPDEGHETSTGLLTVVGGLGAASREASLASAGRTDADPREASLASARGTGATSRQASLTSADGSVAPSPTASIRVVAGEVSGSFSGRSGGAVQVDLPGASRKLRIEREPGGTAPSRFKVAVQRDHSTAITVYAGRATVTIGEQTVRLSASQYVVLRPGELVTNVRTLPASPLLSAPEDGRRWRFREFPPAVTFRWGGENGAGLHRFEVARDPEFRNIVFDEAIEGDSLTLGSLPPGEYLWRVSALRAGVDGSPSHSRRLSLVRDEIPPSLQVAFPDGPIEQDRCLIEGVTEPDCRLFLAGEALAAGADGRFRFEAPLRPGTNLLIVEAVDAAGNSTYRSQIVRRAIPH